MRIITTAAIDEPVFAFQTRQCLLGVARIKVVIIPKTVPTDMNVTNVSLGYTKKHENEMQAPKIKVINAEMNLVFALQLHDPLSSLKDSSPSAEIVCMLMMNRKIGKN